MVFDFLGKPYPVEEDYPESGLAFAAVFGLCRWDEESATAVANCLRNGTLSQLSVYGLANLIDGSNPKGLRLKFQGQGNALRPLEGYLQWERAVWVLQNFEDLRAKGKTWEESVGELADLAGVSESTISRLLQVGEEVTSFEPNPFTVTGSKP